MRLSQTETNKQDNKLLVNKQAHKRKPTPCFFYLTWEHLSFLSQNTKKILPDFELRFDTVRGLNRYTTKFECHLNLSKCDTQTPHSCWSNIGASTRSVQKASAKLRMSVGTYLTMHNANKYFKCDPVCRLCFKEPETVAHIILSCPALHEPRSRFVPQLKDVLVEYDVPCTSDNILQAALDATRIPQIPSTSYPCIEGISIRLCFAVHSTRAYHLVRAGYTFRRPRRKALVEKPSSKNCQQGAKTVAGNSRR